MLPGGTASQRSSVLPEFEEEVKTTESIIAREATRGFNSVTKTVKASTDDPGVATVLTAAMVVAAAKRSGQGAVRQWERALRRFRWR